MSRSRYDTKRKPNAMDTTLRTLLMGLVNLVFLASTNTSSENTMLYSTQNTRTKSPLLAIRSPVRTLAAVYVTDPNKA